MLSVFLVSRSRNEYAARLNRSWPGTGRSNRSTANDDGWQNPAAHAPPTNPKNVRRRSEWVDTLSLLLESCARSCEEWVILEASVLNGRETEMKLGTGCVLKNLLYSVALNRIIMDDCSTSYYPILPK